jgi:hypothetical protein
LLGADNQVNVQQVISDFGEKLKSLDDGTLEALVEGLDVK